jgi:hypothetical protein
MTIKQKLLAACAWAGSVLPDALMVAGAGAVSHGAGIVYQPAGWIVAGVFALVAGYTLAVAAK